MFRGGCPATEKKTFRSRIARGKRSCRNGEISLRLRPARDEKFLFPAGGAHGKKQHRQAHAALSGLLHRGARERASRLRPGSVGEILFREGRRTQDHPHAGKSDGCPARLGGWRPVEAAPNAPFRPGGRMLRAFQGGRFVGYPASDADPPEPGAKKGRRNADGLRMTL